MYFCGKRTKMKKITWLAILGVVLLMGCSKKKTIKSVESDMIEGSWKVSFFEEDGQNETSDYAGYVFTFKSDGSVKAVSGATVVNGTWSTYKDDDHVDFDILLPAPLDDLSDDWDIKNNSANTLELEDVSGGDGSVDYLTFTKI